METSYVLHSAGQLQDNLRHEAHPRAISLIALVLVTLFFDFLAQFLKILPKPAPGIAAREESDHCQNEADGLEFVHGRVSRGLVMGENAYLTTRTLTVQAHAS